MIKTRRLRHAAIASPRTDQMMLGSSFVTERGEAQGALVRYDSSIKY